MTRPFKRPFRSSQPHPRSSAFVPAEEDTSYAKLFGTPQAESRLAAVRRGLARALQEWWQQGQLPSKGLLRDGLLALENGHELDPAECTLLLRAALFYGRGMLTALRHQPDPERTAAVMADMLLHARRPLNPAQIVHLVKSDDMSAAWLAPLLRLLQEEAASGLDPRRTLADAASLALLHRDEVTGLEWVPLSSYPPEADATIIRPQVRLPTPRRTEHLPRVLGVLALLMLILALILFWQDRRNAVSLHTEMRVIPAGTYAIRPDVRAEALQLVQLEAFAMDRTEVTNGAYRRCYDDGVCTWPARVTSVNRPDYFLVPNLSGYPMINVTWEQANTFCTWAGKRLPLAEEWEVAAGSALTLHTVYRFPWGDTFDAAVVNSALSSAGDTQPVGTYIPAGLSPAGVADMAGNVAEWTATPADPDADEVDAFIVKGGSFLSQPDELYVAADQKVEKDQMQPWLGFRCAVTLPTE